MLTQPGIASREAKCLSYYIVKMPNETEYHDENGPQERAKIKFDIF